MNRVRNAFVECEKHHRAALVVYLTHGDPNCEASVELAVAATEGGADVIEFGVPFSDPNADGPVIQAAMQRALVANATLSTALAGVAEMRAGGCDVPVVLFGYYNPIFAMGVTRFAERCQEAGVDAVLTVDLPLGELGELHDPLIQHGIGTVPLVAPTSTDDRVASAAKVDPPFVYYVSMTGITGAKFRGAAGGPDRVKAIRRASGAPVAVGFGVKTPQDAAQVASYADGVVVGSAIVERIAAADSVAAACADVRGFVSELRAAMSR